MTLADGDDLDLIAETDLAMKVWRQGDVIRPACFTYLADSRRPVTAPARAAAQTDGVQGPIVVHTTAAGLVVISQTCDIAAKTAASAPFVEAAVLVELPDAEAREAAAGDRPRFVSVPRLGGTWFADLDQIVTLEKGLLVGYQAEAGVHGDEERAAFGLAVGRKYSRFAFPDDLHRSFTRLLARLRSRHRSDASPEGKMLRRVLQIRIEPDPNWDAGEIDATVTFIVPAGELIGGDEPPIPTQATREWLASQPRPAPEVSARLSTTQDAGDASVLWESLVDRWIEMCAPTGVIRSINAEVVCADEYSVARMWASQQLDLDYLSA